MSTNPRPLRQFIGRLRALVPVCILVLLAGGGVGAEQLEDHRAWQHGIDVIRIGEKFLVIWGSPGNPPRANPGDYWQHDVFYAWLKTSPGEEAALGAAHVLVSRPEAQEPPSTAINASGTLMMTSEDGADGINQQAGLWDSSLLVLRKYPLMIKRGGHSGHVAAAGERFLVVYGEGWVEGGGFLEHGTGKDIYVRIVENDGTRRKETKVAAGHRDGWPLVAGSEFNWLVVWQRYPEMALHSALIDATGRATRPRRIARNMPISYSYAVEFVPALASYLIAGSSGQGGFVALVSLTGEVEKIQHDLPPMASESRLLTYCNAAQCIGVYPVRPRGVAVVRLKPGAIDLVKVIDHPYAWDYTGTAGAFVTPDKVIFVTLSTTGIKLVPIDLR